MLSSLEARRAERLGCKPHEPLVELVDGSGDIGLPEMRIVGVDPFRLHGLDSIRDSARLLLFVFIRNQ